MHLDLGRNQLTGTLPSDLQEFVELRQLHLDHNGFNGTVPESFTAIGNHLLSTLSLDNNQLTGSVPSDYEIMDNLGKCAHSVDCPRLGMFSLFCFVLF